MPSAPAGWHAAEDQAPRASERAGVAQGPAELGAPTVGQTGPVCAGLPSPTSPAAVDLASLAGFPDSTPSRQGSVGSPTFSDVFGPYMRAPRQPKMPEIGTSLGHSQAAGVLAQVTEPRARASQLGSCTWRAAQSQGEWAGGPDWDSHRRDGDRNPARPAQLSPLPLAPSPLLALGLLPAPGCTFALSPPCLCLPCFCR